MATVSRTTNPTTIIGGSSSTEAERWLGIAEKLLSGGDLSGSRSFAARAQQLDPRSDRVLAVVDSLIAGNLRINDLHHDWYAILQLSRFTHDHRLISSQYARLASLLSPVTNSLPFADRALRLVADAFSVLSIPSKKSAYDRDLTESISEAENPREPKSDDASFWTACPYCFNLYEYPREYEDCALRCQNCGRAFHSMAVQSPAPGIIGAGEGGGSYLCSWEFFPLGISDSVPKKAPLIATSNWSPFSAMFACPRPDKASNNAVEGENPNAENKSDLKPKKSNAAKRRMVEVISEDEEVEDFVELSDSEDDDWDDSSIKRRKKRKKKNKNVKVRRISQIGKKTPSELHEGEGNSANQKSVSNPRRSKGKGTKDLGKLDLNVEFSNDAEETRGAVSGKDGEEDGIEGIGFFEGLDEFLDNLPILSVVDEKVKAAE